MSKFHIKRSIWRRDIAKNDFQYGVRPPSWICKISNFCYMSIMGTECASAYQIWSKSDNSRLKYGCNAIFKMAALRHLEFKKIAVFVTRHISACHPSSLLQIMRWWANMAPRYSQKTICNMASVRHLGFSTTAFYDPNVVLNFHSVRFRNFWNILYFMF